MSGYLGEKMTVNMETIRAMNVNKGKGIHVSAGVLSFSRSLSRF